MKDFIDGFFAALIPESVSRGMPVLLWYVISLIALWASVALILNFPILLWVSAIIGTGLHTSTLFYLLSRNR